MSRDIKFRIWDVGQMFSKAIVGTDVNPSIHDGKQWLECTETAVVMQYTGLKDKNGTEIYEGDIVNKHEYWDGDWGNEVASDKIGMIVSGGGGFYMQEADDKKAAWLRPMTADNTDADEIWYEVIGNIYENKELLEAK